MTRGDGTLPFALKFAWSRYRQANRYPDLLVWLRLPGQWEWSKWNVTPSYEGQYELYAFGNRVLAVGFEAAELLVRLLPYRGPEPMT